MKIKIPMRPWKGSEQSPLVDAGILCVLDQWHEDSPGLTVHEIEIGGVEILCKGFELRVQDQGVFMEFVVHNILESSWDAYFDKHTLDDCLEGSGRIFYENNEGEWVRTLKWWAGCDLIVAITELELFELPVQRYFSVGT